MNQFTNLLTNMLLKNQNKSECGRLNWLLPPSLFRIRQNKIKNIQIIKPCKYLVNKFPGTIQFGEIIFITLFGDNRYALGFIFKCFSK